MTGGAGFIGSHLVDEFVRRGHAVDVIDNLEPQVHKTKPGYLNPGATYHFRDIREDGALSDLLPDADVVVHLASMVGVGQSMYQITRYVDANVGGTAKLLQALLLLAVQVAPPVHHDSSAHHLELPGGQLPLLGPIVVHEPHVGVSEGALDVLRNLSLPRRRRKPILSLVRVC